MTGAAELKHNLLHQTDPADFATPALKQAAVQKSRIDPAIAKKINEQAQEMIVENAEDIYFSDEIHESGPPLRQPEARLNNSGKLLLLLTKLGLLNNAMATEQLKSRLAIYAAQSESRAKAAEKLSAELADMEEQYNQALGDVKGALETVTTAKEALDKAKNALSTAKDQLEEMKSAQQEDPTCERAEVIAELEASLSDAEQVVDQKQAHYNASEKKLLDKQQAAETVLGRMNDFTEEMNNKFSDITPAQMNGQKEAVDRSKSALNASGLMIQLLAMMIKQIGENAAGKLKSDMAVNQKRAVARQQEMQRKSDDYEEQVRKSEEAQKTAGCIGKILGGVAIALGAITTIFGGAGVAMMAVGIGLMAADAITEAITGESLTGMIINPLLEHVLMPLMSAIGNIVSKLVDATPLGLLLRFIEKQTGTHFMDTVHSVVTAAVAIAALVAVTLFAKSAAKFAIQKMGNVLTGALLQSVKTAVAQALKKIVPQVVKNGAKQLSGVASKAVQQVSKQISKVAGRVSNQFNQASSSIKGPLMKAMRLDNPAEMNRLLEVSIGRLSYVQHGVQVVNTVTQGVINLNVANIDKEVARILAEFKMAQFDTKLIKQDIDRAMANFEQDEKLAEVLRADITNMLKKSQNTGRQILHNIHV